MALPPYASGIKSLIVAEVTAENAAASAAIADARDEAISDLQTEGATQVSLATTQADRAEDEADRAEAAVAATFQNAGRYIPITEALQEGGVFADFSIPAGVTFTRLFARILGGSGTIDITVLDDGYPVHGPVTVTYGTDTDATISETIATGSDISFFLDNITGSPMGLICKVEGAPA